MQAQIPEIALGYRRSSEPLPSMNQGITVYRGEGVLDGRQVALKFYDLSLHDSGRFRQTLRNEIQAYSSIDFQVAKHIVPYVTSGMVSEGGHEFAVVVTAFMSGGSLLDRLSTDTLLSVPAMIEHSTGIAGGLIELHENKPVAYHLDLKPSNVLYDGKGNVKIADFGTSKLKSEHLGASIGSPYGSLSHIGDMDFRSPEQKDSKKKYPVDHKTDIFQLGLIMWLMAGRGPYTEEGVKPRDLNPDIPDELERIILKASAVDPTKRYDSAREMLYDLQMIGARPAIAGYEQRIRDLIGAHPETPLLPVEVEEAGMLLEEYTRHIEGLNLALPRDYQALLQSAIKRFDRDYKAIAGGYKDKGTEGSPIHPKVVRMTVQRDTVRMINHLRRAHDLFEE